MADLKMRFVLYFCLLIAASSGRAEAIGSQPPPSPPQVSSDEDYRWLYENLFPLATRLQSPDESFKSFRVHLKDTYKTFPQPTDIQQSRLLDFKKSVFVSGRITYAGIVQKSYKMDVVRTPQGLELSVRIHFTDASDYDLNQMQQKIKQAEAIWNRSRAPADFKYYFRFYLVTDLSQAHYSVRLLDQTRGPYDTQWARDWTDTVIAHEIGHMLGLGDEYKTVSGKFDCLMSSLMCSAWNGQLMKHHYYFILRRLLVK